GFLMIRKSETSVLGNENNGKSVVKCSSVLSDWSVVVPSLKEALTSRTSWWEILKVSETIGANLLRGAPLCSFYPHGFSECPASRFADPRLSSARFLQRSLLAGGCSATDGPLLVATDCTSTHLFVIAAALWQTSAGNSVRRHGT